MLSAFVGRTPLEVAKTVALVFFAFIAAVALQQLAATRSDLSGNQGDRSAVLGVARDFGQALTTYDYAHPEVQERRLSALATRDVVARARESFPDLQRYRAASVGESPDVYLQSLDGGRGQVLVRTRSTMQSATVRPGTRVTGLLLCDLRYSGGGWQVSGYEWLTPTLEAADGAR